VWKRQVWKLFPIGDLIIAKSASPFLEVELSAETRGSVKSVRKVADLC
jgi:hypothetical protein